VGMVQRCGVEPPYRGSDHAAYIPLSFRPEAKRKKAILAIGL
jgi:hypothetical protein